MPTPDETSTAAARGALICNAGWRIYIVYFTSWVTEDGQTHFRRDLYRRDAAIEAAGRKYARGPKIVGDRSL